MNDWVGVERVRMAQGQPAVILAQIPSSFKTGRAVEVPVTCDLAPGHLAFYGHLRIVRKVVDK